MDKPKGSFIVVRGGMHDWIIYFVPAETPNEWIKVLDGDVGDNPVILPDGSYDNG